LGLVFSLLYYAFKKESFKAAIVYDWIVDDDEIPEPEEDFQNNEPPRI
jgi:hypothetical protein